MNIFAGETEVDVIEDKVSEKCILECGVDHGDIFTTGAVIEEDTDLKVMK